MASPGKHLEARIADLFGYREAILFGRARSGVITLLEVLGLGPGAGFVMPSNICPSLVMAVHSSGTAISLADVSESNGLASDDALVEQMHRAARPGVVMPSHLYGFVQSYPKTLVTARALGWFVLENDTIATRARLNGANRTAFGDALVVSFGYAKAIEAGGGGVVLTDDIALAHELRSSERTLPPLDDSALEAEDKFMLFARQLRNLHGTESALSDQERESRLFDQAPTCRYSFPENLEAPLANALDNFPHVIAERRRKVEKWNQLLTPFADALPAPQAECVVPWRLIRRAPGIRDRLVEALRKEGIDAGTNFPPLSSSFPILFPGGQHVGAERWGREVLNLWLSSAYEAPQMERAALIIGETLSRANTINR